MQHLWMLHDVAVVSPGLCSNVAPAWKCSSIFNSQHVATRCYRVAKRVQHVAPNNVAICRLAGACKCLANNVRICCVEMLLSFGRGLRLLIDKTLINLDDPSVCLSKVNKIIADRLKKHQLNLIRAYKKLKFYSMFKTETK